MKKLTDNDIHALSAFFAMHHASLAIQNRRPGPRNIERVVMATFGLVEKKGPYRLTARGRRAVELAKQE